MRLQWKENLSKSIVNPFVTLAHRSHITNWRQSDFCRRQTTKAEFNWISHPFDTNPSKFMGTGVWVYLSMWYLRATNCQWRIHDVIEQPGLLTWTIKLNNIIQLQKHLIFSQNQIFQQTIKIRGIKSKYIKTMTLIFKWKRSKSRSHAPIKTSKHNRGLL